MTNKNEKIAIIAPYTTLHGEDKSNRFRSLAALLAERRSVTLVTSRFDHARKFMRSSEEASSQDIPYSVDLIWEPGYRENISIIRVVSHFIFIIGLFWWLIRRGNGFDKFICAAPFSMSAIICKAISRKKVVIDVQDIWPEAFFMLAKNKSVKRLLRSTEVIAKVALKKSDAIISVSSEFSTRCTKLSGGMPAKTIYIGSEVSEELRRICRLSVRDSETIRVVYIGTVGSNYDIRRIAEAVINFNGDKKWELIVVGDGPMLPDMVRRFSDHNQIKFMGSHSFDEMVRITSECHFAINPIIPESSITVTNKVSDYFAIGIPFISGQNSSEVQHLVSQVAPQLCYESGNAASFQSVLRWIEKMSDSEYVTLHERIRRIGDESFMRRSSYLAYEALIDSL
ncbi:glycosyltransferase [Cupriavidus basilensis]|uniref:glycosyltransferase n=1 Tax=Cupriavidus basilensis TaxID=68895 RepID=UPI0020A67DFD|nr:glycosyltransferase [Cupriavidus basilensis]MCP3019498.1 glycosyltransferase [Cupriavidus basilensis]